MADKNLFGDDVEEWREDWEDMPEFIQEEKKAFHLLRVRFEDKEALESFAKLIGQNVNDRTKSIWYPKLNVGWYSEQRYIDQKNDDS